MTHPIRKTKNLKLASVPIYIFATSHSDVGLTNDDMDRFERQYQKMYSNDKFCIIVDGSAVSEIGVYYVNRIVTMLNQLKEKTKSQVIASAIVINSPNIRKVVSTLMYLYTPVSPMSIVESMEEARQYVKDRVRDWEVTSLPR